MRTHLHFVPGTWRRLYTTYRFTIATSMRTNGITKSVIVAPNGRDEILREKNQFAKAR